MTHSPGLRPHVQITIVCAHFNEVVTRALLAGALKTLEDSGIGTNQIETVWVPGSFELPLAALTAAQRPKTDAVICLGAVIRGETPHFEFVSQAAASGILQAGLETGKPVIFGVLTTETVEQAFERAGGKAGNKGIDSAKAALDMMQLLSQIKEQKVPS